MSPCRFMERALRAAGSRVVERAVQSAERPHHNADRLVHQPLVRDVTSNADDLATDRTQLGGQGIGPFHPPRGGRDQGTFSREPADRRRPDAAGGSGDKNDRPAGRLLVRVSGSGC